MDLEGTSETQACAPDTWRRTVSELKKWLEMAVLDLQESKKTGACAMDQSKTLIRERDIWKEKLGIHLDWWSFDKRQLEEALAREKKVQQSIIIAQEYEIASLKISLGFQKQEALRFQLRLELALDDSELLSSRLHFLRLQLGESEAQLKRNSGGCGEEEIKECCGGTELNAAQLVANKLKSEHKIQIEKLKEEHCLAISKSKEERCALMREKNFVWDQLKRVEEGYCNRLSKEEGELKLAEQVIEKLESKVDELQASHADKTVEVAILKINMQTVEEELRQVKEVLVHMKCSGISVDEEQVNNTSVDAKHIVTNKEIELKAALELVDKLQQENQNLRLLYADLEAHATKPKGVKHCWELGKCETTRNLGAELEVEANANANANLVTKPVNLHHEGDEHRQNKLKSKEIQSNISTRKRRSMLDNKKNNEPFSADSAREDNTDTPRGPNMGDLEKHPCQLKHGLLGNSTEQRASKKSRLFSSVFAIPKVLNTT